MNSVAIVGRLTKDPDIRYSQGQNPTAVARFTVAVDRRYKKEGEQSADFISCIAFGKTAEFIEKYFHKGNRIGLTGRIQTGSYKNKDGNTVYTTDVVAEQVEFCESKANIDNQVATSWQQPQGQPVPDNAGFMAIPDNLDDEGLPFF